VRAKPTESLDAYDCLLRALSLLYPLEDGAFLQAGTYLDRAIELDGAYVQAHAYKAWWYVLLSEEGLTKDFERDAAAAEAESQLALSLDPNDAFALAVAAHIQSLLHRRLDLAYEMFERASQLNRNSAFAWGDGACPCCSLGKPEEALERLRIASRLSPFDLLNFFFWTGGRDRRVRRRTLRPGGRLARKGAPGESAISSRSPDAGGKLREDGSGRRCSRGGARVARGRPRIYDFRVHFVVPAPRTRSTQVR